MTDYKTEWRNFQPPMVPVYFMDVEELRKMLKANVNAMSMEGLEMCLGYYEEYEKFEHAALIRDAIERLDIFYAEGGETPQEQKGQVMTQDMVERLLEQGQGNIVMLDEEERGIFIGETIGEWQEIGLNMHHIDLMNTLSIISEDGIGYCLALPTIYKFDYSTERAFRSKVDKVFEELPEMAQLHIKNLKEKL